MKVLPRLTDEQFRSFQRLLEDHSGIVLPPARRSQLQQAVVAACRRYASDDPSSLCRHLASPEGHIELEHFIASLTVGETHFFRNTPQFNALEEHVLPDLIQQRRAERRLRIWSAGCSTGEEPYSLAMLLDRMLPDRRSWNLTILATDIDREALAKAAQARYGSWSFRGVDDEIRSRYFTDEDGKLSLDPRIRDMVTFEYLNLVEDAYPSLLTNTNAIDLVVCRNVLIYFSEKTARSVVARFHSAMAEGAWLFLGHAEPSQWLTDRFSIRPFEGAVAYRRAEDDATVRDRPPAARQREVKAAPRSARRPRPKRPRPRGAGRKRSAGELQPARSVEELCEVAIERWRSGDAEGAIADLEAVTDDHVGNPRPPYLIAKIFADRLESEAADRWNAVALERDRLFAPAHYLRGLIAVESGNREEAVAAFRRCIYADPGWPLGHFVLADALLHLGQKRRASGPLRMLERLLENAAPEQEVPDGDGVTAGRLLELVQMHKEIHGLAERSEASS